MERLTERCWMNLDPWECCGQDNYCKRDCHELGGCANGCQVPKLYVRLAGYEDTGLMPDDIITENSPDIPLSLSELKKKIGMPVWISLRKGKGFWAIPKSYSRKSDSILFYGMSKLSCKEYRRWWMAYSKKPKEDVHD